MLAPPKFILILAVIVAVWYAMRWFTRQQARMARRQRAPRPAGAGNGRGPRAIEDLVACRLCGSYVATGAGGCGKPGCPQPR